MSFSKFLEEVIGVSWEYFDNNYSGNEADEIYQMYYDEYCRDEDEQ